MFDNSATVVASPAVSPLEHTAVLVPSQGGQVSARARSGDKVAWISTVDHDAPDRHSFETNCEGHALSSASVDCYPMPLHGNDRSQGA